MVPPKSYADMVRGARKSPPPPSKAYPAPRPAAAPPLAALPVLSPSSSFSSVLLAESESHSMPPPFQQQKRGVTGGIRSYAAAVKGTYNRPSSLPPPSPSPPMVEMEDLAIAPSAPSPPSLPPPELELEPAPQPRAASEPNNDTKTELKPELEPEVEPEVEPEPAGISLWENGLGHDVVIICGDARWYVHRRVLVRMSKFMEKYLPPVRRDGRPVVWNLNRRKWHAPMLSNVLRFMYVEEYDNCDYDYDKPLDTESINVNVNHFIAGASVHCRPMMDHALSRLEEATEELHEVAATLRHARLDDFQHGIRRAHLSMWAQPDQWRLLSLRIVMGKLMAVALPVILQSPLWTPRYRQLWGGMHPNAVADHMWLHTAGFCPHAPAITRGFQHLQVMWVKYRPNGWRLEDDFMSPEGKGVAPPPPSPPSTPHRSAKKKNTILGPRPDSTVDPSQAMPRGSHRGQGRGDHSTGRAQPVDKAPNDRDKEQNKGDEKTTEEAVAGTTDEAGPSPINGPPPSAGPYPNATRNPAVTASTIMLDRPMPVGFSPHAAGTGTTANPLAHQAAAAAAVPAWVWPQTHQLYRPPPPFAPGFVLPASASASASAYTYPYPSHPHPHPQPLPTTSTSPTSSSSNNRPSSSSGGGGGGGQLSATAEPFVMPGGGGRAAVTEPSTGRGGGGGCFSSSSSSVSRISSPVVGSPARRLTELYVPYLEEEEKEKEEEEVCAADQGQEG